MINIKCDYGYSPEELRQISAHEGEPILRQLRRQRNEKLATKLKEIREQVFLEYFKTENNIMKLNAKNRLSTRPMEGDIMRCFVDGTPAFDIEPTLTENEDGSVRVGVFMKEYTPLIVLAPELF